MLELLRRFFEREKIEYYSALDYVLLEEINPRLVRRHGFIPKSAVIFLLPYFTGVPENISCYSASLDYHIIIREITDKLIAVLKESYPDNNFVGFGDHSPINERSAALMAGLGILGDNGLLITPKYGSYVFIADLITDLPPEVIGAVNPVPVSRCEGCGTCKAACPTGRLDENGAECLSQVTQKKGELSEEEISLIKRNGTVWGCDVCQSVCPHNKNAPLTPIDFFYEHRIEKLTKRILDSMDDDEFKKRAFAWRGRKTVERNLGCFEE